MAAIQYSTPTAHSYSDYTPRYNAVSATASTDCLDSSEESSEYNSILEDILSCQKQQAEAQKWQDEKIDLALQRIDALEKKNKSSDKKSHTIVTGEIWATPYQISIRL